MPQLHLYVSEQVAARVREQAQVQRMTVSRYLAELVKHQVGSGWPPGFFQEVVGGWKGEPVQRPPQGDFERREGL